MAGGGGENAQPLPKWWVKWWVRQPPKNKALNNQGFIKYIGGGAGIRTLDASFSSHTPLAGEPLQPLGHAS